MSGPVLSSGAFVYTSNPRIDNMYREVKDTISQFRKEGGHLEVAYDTFLTAAGTSEYKETVAHGLVVTLVAVVADLDLHFPLPIIMRFPGFLINPGSIKSPEVHRIWELWLTLASETTYAIRYLNEHMNKAVQCAQVPTLITKVIEELSSSADIRTIDIRKLNRVAEINSPLLLGAAESLHKAVRKVGDIVSQAIRVYQGLKDNEELQRTLLKLSSDATRLQTIDPVHILEQLRPDLEALVADLPGSDETMKDGDVF